MNTTKKCARCGTEKDLEMFGNRLSSKDGKHPYCKGCSNAGSRKSKKKLRDISKVFVEEKTCSGCNTTKPRDKFNKSSYAKTGLSPYCKDCVKNRNAISMSKLKERLPTVKSKVCPDCEIEKSSSEFYLAPKRKDGLAYRCKECDRRGSKERSDRRVESPKRYVEEKMCPGCGYIKPRGSFYSYSRSTDGLSVYCKDCSRDKCRETRSHMVPKYPKVERKVCGICKEDKAAEDFYNGPYRSDGLDWECKDCKKNRSAQWIVANPDRKKENDKRQAEITKADGRMSTWNRRWRERNPEYRKEWAKKNKEYLRKYAREYMRIYRKLRPDKIRIHSDNSRRKNLKKDSDKSMRRYHRELEMKFELTKEDLTDVFMMFRNCCAFCGSSDKLTTDHVIPISRVDIENPGTVRWNLMPLCKYCNSSKRDKTLDEYLHGDHIREEISAHLQERDMDAEDLILEINYLLGLLKGET